MKLPYLINALTVVSLILVSANAGNAYGGRNQNKNEKLGKEGKLYPSEDLQNSPDTKQKYFELNIDKTTASEVQRKIDAYRKSISGTLNATFNMTPKKMPFKLMNFIYVHPSYQTTVVFPEKYTLHIPIFSEKLLSLPVASRNILSFKVNRNFLEGNVVVPMHSNDGNTLVTIILRKYDASDSHLSAKEKGILPAFSSVIQFVDTPKLSNMDVLDKYIDFFGENNLIRKFKRDGDYDTIIISDTIFYIIRDDKEGTIEINNINFRISNHYESF